MNVGLSIFAGIIPMTIYPFFFYWMDRYEKEPLPLLFGIFLWGFIPAAVLSLVSQLILGVPFMLLDETGFASELAGTIVLAPITEEIFKGMAVWIVYLILRSEFDGVFDGIVFGAMVGFGFAAIENILYFISADGAYGLIFLRAFVFGLNHALYTAMTGVGFGIARHARTPLTRFVAPIGGLLAAMLLHGLHNGIATLATYASGLFIILAVLLNWIAVAGVFTIMMVSLRRERQWIQDHLRPEISLGTLSQAQYDQVAAPGKRFAARLEALQTGGLTRFNATGKFFLALTELAYKKHANQVNGEKHGATTAEIEKLRSRAAQMGAQIAK